MARTIAIFPGHTITQEIRSTGTCGDAYCGGHSETIWTCSCGEPLRAPYTDSQLHGVDEKVAVLTHVLGGKFPV